jgi:hypothetical protein
VRGVSELRAEARAKRRIADVVRRLGPLSSSTRDRDLMLQHAQELEAEAAGLEAQATTLQRTRST